VVTGGGETLKIDYLTQQASIQEGASSITFSGRKGTLTEHFLYEDGAYLFSPDERRWYRLGADLSVSGEQAQSVTDFLSNAQELNDIRLVARRGNQASYEAQFAHGALNKVLAATEGSNIAQEVQFSKSHVVLVTNVKESSLESLQASYSFTEQGQAFSVTLTGHYTRLGHVSFPRVVPVSTITSTQELENLIEGQIKK